DVARRPTTGSQVTAALVLVGLALAAAGGILQRRTNVAAPAMTGLALCGALTLVAADTPTRPILMKSIGYTLWWGSPAGMFAWLVLGWSALTLTAPRLPALARLRVP